MIQNNTRFFGKESRPFLRGKGQIAHVNPCLIDLYDKVQAQFMVANYLLAKHTHEQQKVAAGDHRKILIMLKGKNYAGTRELLAQHIDGARDKILRKMRI